MNLSGKYSDRQNSRVFSFTNTEYILGSIKGLDLIKELYNQIGFRYKLLIMIRVRSFRSMEALKARTNRAPSLFELVSFSALLNTFDNWDYATMTFYDDRIHLTIYPESGMLDNPTNIVIRLYDISKDSMRYQFL